MSQKTLGQRAKLGSFIVDGQGTILGFDEAMEALTNWPAIEIVGRDKSFALAHDVAAPLYEEEITTDPLRRPSKLTLHCRDGKRIEAQIQLKPLSGPGERTLVSVLGVLSRSDDEDSYLEIEPKDPLTSLPNREAFASRLSAAFHSASTLARPLSLVLVDVDRLRLINDREGREAGDNVLRRLAGILRMAVADEHRVARLGDDDFAVIVTGGGRAEARQLAASLRSTVERFEFFPGETSETRVTLSLGAASFPADADSEKELIDRAKDALDEARTMGRNRVWCYMRRPRVPVQVPVYFDGADPLLVGYSRDLSPSGVFVQTTERIDIGMRCALAFPLPGREDKVHVVGRVVRSVTQASDAAEEVRIPGVGIEFERFGGGSDRRAIDGFLHGREASSLRPEDGRLSIGDG